MQFILKSQELEISHDFEKYARKKLSKLEKYFENSNLELVKIIVEINKISGRHRKGEFYKAEVDLSAPGEFFRSESESGDFYSAIDIVEDQLKEDIRKAKTKKQTMFRRGARSIKKKASISPLARFKKNK
ncbi:MAG: ribosome-associated translation inhibitor RaiA [Candidatus Portnoybacteria bacterium]|nr:ribosome-associated translation inhibitor RaiA [Candidatus Portnoybacteria bacterium]